jgi:hypothetical protein
VSATYIRSRKGTEQRQKIKTNSKSPFSPSLLSWKDTDKDTDTLKYLKPLLSGDGK